MFSKSPTFSLRTSILLLASVILAPIRKYKTRHIGQKTPVAPLCEWISRIAKRHNWNFHCSTWYDANPAIVNVCVFVSRDMMPNQRLTDQGHYVQISPTVISTDKFIFGLVFICLDELNPSNHFTRNITVHSLWQNNVIIQWWLG